MARLAGIGNVGQQIFIGDKLIFDPFHAGEPNALRTHEKHPCYAFYLK
jgi:hypothetical protein